ncbi:MAG: FAD-dependent oxidoreductase [Candidatus Babeliales bacterium]|nr:FAD-dependent oxidoreductase [Candidatus Babeliales bacterium]
MKKTHILIGASAAGIAAANKLRQLDALSTIIMISDELEAPYNKCMLADYMAGIKQESQVHTLTLAQAQQKNITLMLGSRVEQVLPEFKQIALDDGTAMNYDTLLIATGTSPFVPAIDGLVGTQGVFTFHRLRDIQAIMAYIKNKPVKKVVVIGSGLSGLECADALLPYNVQVSIIEMQGQVLSSIINDEGAQFIQSHMAKQGVHFYPDQKVEQIMHHEGYVTGVKLASGQLLEADMVIVAAGLKPNIELAKSAGIILGDYGIETNDYMQTSIADIYAAGDIALVKDQLTGTIVPSRMWPDAMLQGLVAASSMAGHPRIYPGIASVISSSFFGIKFAACGPVLNPQGCQKIVNQGSDFYHLLLVKEDKLKGFLLVGNTGKCGILRQAVMTQVPVTLEMLLP